MSAIHQILHTNGTATRPLPTLPRPQLDRGLLLQGLMLFGQLLCTGFCLLAAAQARDAANSLHEASREQGRAAQGEIQRLQEVQAMRQFEAIQGASLLAIQKRNIEAAERLEKFINKGN